MSSIPGYTLEKFLAWNYDLIVGGDGSANPSLQIAEALGTATKARREVTDAQMAELVKIFEHRREDVEAQLDMFDEEEQSWRQYAAYAFDCIEDAEYEKGLVLINSWLGSPRLEE